MKTKIILLILLFCFLFGSEKNYTSPYVVVVSLDGFRWNYTDSIETPNFDKIAKYGITSQIIPSFPSKTFPNHYTMATGLYPDHHGIVLNDFYNYDKNRWYRVSDRNAVEDGTFYKGEPIWNTAEKQGITTGTLFWVGSEANVNGMQPTYWKQYDHHMPFENRIDTVMSWLSKPIKTRPRLVMWYLHQPDSWGHKLGPENPQINAKIIYLDSLMGVFYDKLNLLPIKDSINVIITSDHGMGNIDIDKVEIIDNYIKKKWLRRNIGSNPFYMFEPKEKYVDSVYFHLRKAEHLSVWKKSQIPAYLHFGTNNNIMPIVAIADSGWSIFWNSDIKMKKYLGGTHGYDPINQDMHAIFYAYGPKFKINYQHQSFKNIHLYSLIARLLEITPSENDGDINKIIKMLKE